MAFEVIAALALFVVSTSITPGPNNVMIMTNGANFGWRLSLPHLAGIELGFGLMVVLVGFGVSGIFQAFPQALLLIKILGVSYLTYMAWRIATTSSKVGTSAKAKPFSFVQAVAFQWVNAKAWIMAIGAVVAFTGSTQYYAVEVLTIALMYVVLGTPCTSFWLVSGTLLRKWLNRGRNLMLFNWLMALLLMISILPTMMEIVAAFQ